MFSVQENKSASGRGIQATDSDATITAMDNYRVLMPRLPTGNLVLNSVFLHGDLAARPYRAPDFRDALKGIIDLKDIIAMGQYQMSHVWMVQCATSLAKAKLVACEDLKVKGRKCLVVDPETKEVKIRLLWLPPYMENRRIVEAMEPYGTVRSVVREKWRCEGMEDMETLNREVQLTLRDDTNVNKIPHLMTIFGCQSLLLISGRPPSCLRCHRVGHIRRHCRTPWCAKCRRYGHKPEDCVMTYADRLRLGTTEESTTENLMDVSEVVDPNGDVSAMAAALDGGSQSASRKPVVPENLTSATTSSEDPIITVSPATENSTPTNPATPTNRDAFTNEKQCETTTEANLEDTETEENDEVQDPILELEALTNVGLNDGLITRAKHYEKRLGAVRHKPYSKTLPGAKLVEDKQTGDNARP